jgi:hypothetical protein
MTADEELDQLIAQAVADAGPLDRDTLTQLAALLPPVHQTAGAA